MAAEQFTASKTAMAIAKMTSITTAWDAQGVAHVTGAMQSLSTPQHSYLMNATDWVVVGPNVEVVYSDAQFKTIFTKMTGAAITISLGPGGTDPMSAEGFIWASGAGGAVNIDWGDNGPHDTGNATPAAPLALAHTYVGAGDYTVVAVLTGGNTVTMVYSAMDNPPAPNTIDLSTMGPGAAVLDDSGSPDEVDTATGESELVNQATYGQSMGRGLNDQPITGQFTVVSGTYTEDEMNALLAGESLPAPPPTTGDVMDPSADMP
jgi:hypothetical protein